MRDPKPGNISGEKVQQHVFKHSINWGYVALALAVIVVGLKIAPVTSSGDDEDKNQDPATETGL
jgi:Ni/Fe-hydrogenase subunit HybB-like protein